MSIVIAVDGTAASGKGTLAKKLAAHFGFHYLDSGALYRLVGLGVAEAHGDPHNEADALAAARHIDHTRADDPAIRTAEMGRLAAIVAPHQSVRKELLDYQRAFARREPGAVLDGRDIGTVVCPEADVKFFVDASPEVRAHRRMLELHAAGRNCWPAIAPTKLAKNPRLSPPRMRSTSIRRRLRLMRWSSGRLLR